MDPRLQKILNREIVYIVARQLVLRRYVAQASNWNVDFEEGVQRWDEDIAFRTEFLGSLDFESGTWLWGWANQCFEFDTALKVSRKFQQYGEQNQIKELAAPGFKADESVAMVLTVLCTHLP